MTHEQITFINEQLRFLGFTEYTPEQLMAFVAAPEFELTQTNQYGADTLEAILHFRYSTNYDVHFFNKHVLTLKEYTQLFYLSCGKGITRKEGYNLLCGRAVYKKLFSKEGEEYFVWLQFDFSKKDETGYHLKRYYDNYGFQISGALDQIGLMPYNNWDRAMLIRSLQRGNLQPVLLESGKAWIEANPQERKINIHTHNIPTKPTVSGSKRKRIPSK